MKIAAISHYFPTLPNWHPGDYARNVITNIFKKCEKGWSYIGKAIKITQLSLNASAIRGEAKVIQAVHSLKIFSVFSIPFNIATISSTAQSVIKNIQRRDLEGGILGGITLGVLAIDLFDSIGTIINASLTLASQATLQVFSTVSMPISFCISGIGSITRSFSLIKTCILFAKFRKDPHNFMQKVDRGALERYAPGGIIESPKDISKIDRSFKKKIAIDIGYLVANILTLIALSLLAAGIFAPVGVTILAVAMSLRLILTAAQDVPT